MKKKKEERLKKKKGNAKKKKEFAFHLFNTVTNHTAVATILFKIDIK